MHFEWNGIINFYCGFNCNWCQISMKSHKLVYTKTNAVDLLVGWFNFSLIQWQNYADLQSIGWYSKYCINAILNVSFVLRLKFSPKLLIFFVIAAITVKILHFDKKIAFFIFCVKLSSFWNNKFLLFFPNWMNLRFKLGKFQRMKISKIWQNTPNQCSRISSKYFVII